MTSATCEDILFYSLTIVVLLSPCQNASTKTKTQNTCRNRSRSEHACWIKFGIPIHGGDHAGKGRYRRSKRTNNSLRQNIYVTCTFAWDTFYETKEVFRLYFWNRGVEDFSRYFRNPCPKIALKNSIYISEFVSLRDKKNTFSSFSGVSQRDYILWGQLMCHTDFQQLRST